MRDRVADDRAAGCAGTVVLAGALVVATVVGLVLQRRNGRVRQATPSADTPHGWDLAGVAPEPDDRVLRTPTTAAFDRAGSEILRVGGVPRRADLVAALPLEETR